MKLTPHTFHTVFGDALRVSDRSAFISDWSLSTIWNDDPDDDIPPERLRQLGKIWDAAHLSIRDIRAETGLSQVKFGEAFAIPRRSIENWESETTEAPPYTRLLLANAVGIIDLNEIREIN